MRERRRQLFFYDVIMHLPFAVIFVKPNRTESKNFEPHNLTPRNQKMIFL